jgi:uncharacterized membrane protein YtjA (UPF0391 family)
VQWNFGLNSRPEKKPTSQEGGHMLSWALSFLVVALIAGVLGFTGIAIAAAGIARVLFFIFVILFLVSLLGHLFRGRNV